MLLRFYLYVLIDAPLSIVNLGIERSVFQRNFIIDVYMQTMDLDVETKNALLTFMLMYSRIIYQRISSAEIEDFSEKEIAFEISCS